MQLFFFEFTEFIYANFKLKPETKKALQKYCKAFYEITMFQIISRGSDK